MLTLFTTEFGSKDVVTLKKWTLLRTIKITTGAAIGYDDQHKSNKKGHWVKSIQPKL